MWLHSTRTSFCLGFRISSHLGPNGTLMATHPAFAKRAFFFTTVTRCSELLRETLCRLEIACDFLHSPAPFREGILSERLLHSRVESGKTVKGANCTICFHVWLASYFEASILYTSCVHHVYPCLKGRGSYISLTTNTGWDSGESPCPLQ